MNSYHISLYAEGEDFAFDVAGSSNFYFEFITIFSEEDKASKKRIVRNYNIIDKKNIDNISELINKFTSEDQSVKKIEAFFKNRTLGEYIFITPVDKLQYDQIIYIFKSLELLNKGIPLNQVDQKLKPIIKSYTDLFGEIDELYNIQKVFGDKTTRIGEKIKSKRKCRFCTTGPNESEKFKNNAHAIPEALGNKNIYANEECDICSSNFDQAIERDLTNFFEIFRVIFGIKGKRKIPKIKFKNSIVMEQKNGIPTVIFPADNPMVNSEKNETILQLEPSEKINWMNIYRCLCKISLSVLDAYDTNIFSETVSWIKKEKFLENSFKLPMVAISIKAPSETSHPRIINYIRRSDANTNLPYLVTELRIKSFILVYIVPFIGTDKNNFSNKDEYNIYWEKFKHYHKLSDWQFYDLSDDKEMKIKYDIKLRQR